MSKTQIRPVLAGQKALVVGVANDQSIAYGCAKAFRTVGADIAITWLNERARPMWSHSARELEAPIMGRSTSPIPGELEAMFDQIRTKWGQVGYPRALDRFRAESRICRAGCSIVRRRVSRRRWTFRAIHSSGWRSSPRR